MNWLPREGHVRLTLLALVVFFIGCCLDPPYVDYQLMQQAPTAVAIVALAVVWRWFPLGRLNTLFVALFLALHALGARYLYSYTPYDEWTAALFRARLSDLFGWERNHFDRFVHFCYGLLIVGPIREFEYRYLALSRLWATLLAIEAILATSAGYEIFEWIVAIVFSHEYADQFLGQQGDAFDAQKDMALAAAGAVVATCIAVAVTSRERECPCPASPCEEL